MKMPQIKEGQFFVIRADFNTGKIKNYDNTFYMSEGKDYYRIFNNIDEAKQFAHAEVFEKNDNVETIIFDHNAQSVERIAREYKAPEPTKNNFLSFFKKIISKKSKGKTMKKMKINYHDLVFICAYIKQLELSLSNLSLDENKWNLWLEARNFLSSRLEPSRLINYFSQKYEVPDTEVDWTKYELPNKRKFLFKKLFTSYLYDIELLYFYKLLKTFNEYLSFEIEDFYNLRINKLSLDAVLFYIYLCDTKISRRDAKKIKKVEYFNSPKNIKTIKLQYFFPKDFKRK